MTTEIQIRKCTSLDDFHRCVALQREIWNESDLETEPYVTFVVAANTGGQVLGAFDGGNMVGFTLGMVGLRDDAPYIHSHMTGVLASHRDRRIGRQLKLCQREEALSRNIRRVEWTFDPLETRNAHFNFNRLGAFSRHLIPNFYGVTTSPLHRGLPTDRLLVEWQLDTKRVIAAIKELVSDPTGKPVASIHLPAEMEKWKSDDPDRVAQEQRRIREEFQTAFAKNYAATTVTFSPQGASYHLTPWSDF
jgi:predicted GNAT superfamily acetyltransferase